MSPRASAAYFVMPSLPYLVSVSKSTHSWVFEKRLSENQQLISFKRNQASAEHGACNSPLHCKHAQRRLQKEHLGLDERHHRSCEGAKLVSLLQNCSRGAEHFVRLLLALGNLT